MFFGDSNCESEGDFLLGVATDDDPPWLVRCCVLRGPLLRPFEPAAERGPLLLVSTASGSRRAGPGADCPRSGLVADFRVCVVFPAGRFEFIGVHLASPSMLLHRMAVAMTLCQQTGVHRTCIAHALAHRLRTKCAVGKGAGLIDISQRPICKVRRRSFCTIGAGAGYQQICQIASRGKARQFVRSSA